MAQQHQHRLIHVLLKGSMQGAAAALAELLERSWQSAVIDDV